MMLTIFWNPEGFPIVDVLPSRQIFNSEYFIENILKNIYKIFSSRAEEIGRPITLHFDNARPHTSRKVQEYMDSHNMKKAVQPPYSPDIAPSDFFLFGYIKNILKGSKFESRDELKAAIDEILSSFPKNLLDSVFLKWENKLQQVIESNGDYLQ